VLESDPRFSTALDRKRNEAALDEVVSRWTKTHDRWDITHRLQAAGVAAFPSLSPVDLWSGDPHLEAIGMLERPHHGAVGAMTVPGVPWRLSTGANGLRMAAPLLGQHTVEVLSDVLRYSADEIGTLLATRVVTAAD
jgi:crotonobetainyl-CoA:carnitine CoA-transferase CaiB-like acyl-CoA transferase